MELVFEQTRYLYFLVFIPIVIITHYLVLRVSKKQAIPFANYNVLSRISKKYVFSQNNGQLIVRIIIMILLCFSIAGAQLYVDVNKASSNTVILVDASDSMVVLQNQSTSWIVAKDFVSTYLAEHNYLSSLSVLSYSTVSKVVIPPTKLQQEARKNLVNLQPHNIAGTDLGTAIYNSIHLLYNLEGPKRVLIITDGRASFGSSIEAALQQAIAYRTKIDAVVIDWGQEKQYEVLPDSLDMKLSL
jgi:hypothetical protein